MLLVKEGRVCRSFPCNRKLRFSLTKVLRQMGCNEILPGVNSTLVKLQIPVEPFETDFDRKVQKTLILIFVMFIWVNMWEPFVGFRRFVKMAASSSEAFSCWPFQWSHAKLGTVYSYQQCTCSSAHSTSH